LQSDVKEREATPPVEQNLNFDFSDTATSRSEVDSPALEIKGSMFTLPVLRLRSTDMDLIAKDLSQRLAQHLSFFEHAPVVIELDHLDDQANRLDLPALCALLRQVNLVPVGVRQANPEQAKAAIAAGLAVLKGGSSGSPRTETPAPASKAKVTNTPSKHAETAKPRAEALPAKVISQPVRSGQQVYARGGDLIVLAAVNAGAEVIADGNIHIYAPLRGRALAGVQGDSSASIFTQSMEAELVAIAGNYQVFEDGPAKDIYSRAVRIFLDDTNINISPLS